MHAEEAEISSGYSTFSSGKEEINLTRHLANAAASKAAARSMQIQKPERESIENGAVKNARTNQRVETKFEGHTESSLIELM